MPPKGKSAVVVRTATAEDVATCGQICYDAFTAINTAHGFPPDFPNPEVAEGLISSMFSNPDYYCVVAEIDGRIIGSNGLDERAIIRGVGPITIHPEAQNMGVGRLLMQAVMDRARDRGAAGSRLVQAAFHNRSLSLYTSFGFDVREPLSCLQGAIREPSFPGCQVRPATVGRRGCLQLALSPRSWLRPCRRAGNRPSRTAPPAWSSEEARSPDTRPISPSLATPRRRRTWTCKHSCLRSEGFAGPGILVPSRNSVLLRWCLQNGLRVVEPMTLMSAGLYNDPAGAWLPSVLF